MMKESACAKFRFVVSDQDPDATSASLLERLKKGLEEAIRRTQMPATAELEGGFLGLGETAVVLAVWHAAKAAGAAFALGAAGAAGKSFYTDYLAPELIKLNLLPSKFQEINQKSDTSKAKATAKKPVTKKSAAKKTVAKKAGTTKKKKPTTRVAF
jgi:hypothetical protein